MIVTLKFAGTTYKADLSKGIDISLPINHGPDNPNCYWAEDVKFETIQSGSFIGSVALGGSVNYQKVILTPHGNGTHTECLGHITAGGLSINKSLKQFHFIAQLISVKPETANEDQLISLDAIQNTVGENRPEAIIIRTLPNDETKKLRQYSGTNPPYLDVAATKWLNTIGVKHLLIDLPSIDRESDGGKLLAHKGFWGLPDKYRENCTITELIFVPSSVPDGLYLLNLQICSLETDAAPSKPVLYEISEI